MPEVQVWGDFEFTPDDESSLIGSGGFSKVYRARQRSLKRDVALKVFDRARLNHPPEVLRELLTRFQNEAIILARLKHPNIVTALQFGESGTSLYLAMEYVDGENLFQHFTRVVEEKAALDEKEIVRIGLKIVAGLKAAYNCRGDGGNQPLRIIHRDIKPTNILIGRDGEVKITDFGLACLVRSETGPATSSRDKERVTRFGSEIGTPQYMAPETFEGLSKADHRSDIYSLGVLLYELATNTTPFTGNWDELRHKHMTKPVDPPTELRPKLSERLCAVIMKCLQKRPEDRYFDYAELERDLKEAEDPRPPAAPAVVAKRQRHWWMIPALAAVVCAAVAMAAALMRPDKKPQAPAMERREEKRETAQKPVKEEPAPKVQESKPADQLHTPPEQPKPQPQAEPTPSPFVKLLDQFVMSFEFEVARRLAKEAAARHESEIARRDFGPISAEMAELALRSKGWRQKALGYEADRFKAAEALVGKFVKALKAADSKETAIYLSDGTSLSAQVKSVLPEIVLNVSGRERIVKYADLDPRNFLQEASALDRFHFLSADRRSVEALTVLLGLPPKDPQALYFLPSVLPDALAEAHRGLRDHERFDKARLLLKWIDEKPLPKRQLGVEGNRIVGLLRRETEAVDLLERGEEAAVAKKFPGTIALKRLASKVYERVFANTQPLEIDDEEAWEFFGPDPQNARLETDAGGIVLEHKNGIVWGRHAPSDLSRGFEVAFAVAERGKRAGVAVLLRPEDEVQRQVVFDVDRSEIVFAEIPPVGDSKTLARRPVVGHNADKVHKLSLALVHDTLFIFFDGALVASEATTIARDPRIGVRNAELRIRELRVVTKE